MNIETANQKRKAIIKADFCFSYSFYRPNQKNKKIIF